MRGLVLGNARIGFMLNPRRYYRKIRVNTARAGPCSVKLVSRCAKELGMEVVYLAKPDCDLYWHRRDYLAQKLPPDAYVSTTPGIKDVFSKSILALQLNKMQELFPDEYQFYPRSWRYPEECGKLDLYIKERNRLGESPTFIFKPSHGSLGIDIFLFKDLNSLNYPEPAVIQEYISNPLLLDSLKFDMRLYVLVASYDPVEVYISKTGLTRSCTVPYQSPTVDNLNNDYMHLTNYAVNKNNSNYSLEMGKSTLSHTLGLLRQQHNIDDSVFWTGVKDIVAKTLIAVLPKFRIEARSYMLDKQIKDPLHCFQVSII